MNRNSQADVELNQASSLVISSSYDGTATEATNTAARAAAETVLEEWLYIVDKEADKEADKELDSRLWQSLYQEGGHTNSSSEAHLEVASLLLREAWSGFVIDSQDQQSALYTKVNPLSEYSITSMEDLKTAVSAEREKWKGPGRARRLLDQVLGTLDSHSDLFSIIPSQNQYCSVFCGVVKTLVNASTNHRKIIEGLAKDLTEIGDVVYLCAQHAQLFRTTDMKELIQQLYTAVFTFLREAVRWYGDKKRKRLLNSFNQDFYEKFSNMLKEICRIEKLVHTKGLIASHAELRDSHTEIRNTQSSIKKILNAIERVEVMSQAQADNAYWQRQSSNLEERYASLEGIEERLQTSHNLARFFENANISLLAAPESKITRDRLPEKYDQFSRSGMSTNCDHDGVSGQKYEKERLQEYSRALEDNIENIIDPIDLIESTHVFADHGVIYEIQQWSAAQGSQMLWIMGPPERQFPNSASSIAAGIINSADELNIPLIYIFCSWPLEEEKAIMTFLYSLLRQVISLLPLEIETSIDLSCANFQRLDGTVKTWDDGLLILSELLHHMPSLSLAIIDGIEHLDYLNIGQQYIVSVLTLLQNHVNNTRGGIGKVAKTFKVLFTTAGNCACLNEVDDQVLKIVKASEHQKHNPGKALPERAELPSLD